MKFRVNERCIGCGLCTGICPDVFSMAGDVAEAADKSVEDTIKNKAVEAMESCPVDAIEKA